MFPLSSDKKLVVCKLRLQLYILLEEMIAGALQEVWRNIHCHNILILKLEEWLPSGNTQQFQGLDIVGTHVTDSGNNLQSSILDSLKNLTNEVIISASMAEVVSN
jgi:hypothetical protein